MKTRIASFAAGLAIAAIGCGGAPKPEARLVSSESAIRGAQEAGADHVPVATLHVKLAEEQREQAIALIKNGENHRAGMLLARSEADAELAIALSRAASAHVEATSAEQTVDTLKEKAAQ